MADQLFALEQYNTAGDQPGPAPHLPSGGPVRLITLFRLPEDEVLLALVEGPDSSTAAEVMTRAGWRVDRIAPAAWVLSPLLRPAGPAGSPTWKEL